MKKAFVILPVTVLAASLLAQPSNPPAPPSEKISAEISPRGTLTTMKAVADWQLANMPATTNRSGQRTWTYAALYTGVMALSDIADTRKYHDAMVEMGNKYNWEPAARRFHADDYCVSQTYLELYLKDHDPAMLKPTKEAFDFILAHPETNDMYITHGGQHRWNWCDALFMGPPAWARLYQATGDSRYLDFIDREWGATSDFLYDKEEHLYFRDSTFFQKREANGKKIFWSRGNGWVMAGFARTLPFLPTDHPRRKQYEQQFKEMAAKIITLQQADGLWRSSLLDPESYPLQETSGSGFYTFALAWGINNGLLDRATYEPAVRKGWTALVGCVTPEGKLEHVQPVGADPKHFEPTHTDVFGVGAFLLAGSEVYRLAPVKANAAN